MDCKDEVKAMEKLEFNARKVKSENDTVDNHYMETFVKVENSVISTHFDTDIKTEMIMHENDSMKDQCLDTYPPDSYHFLLQEGNEVCTCVSKVKEEKPCNMDCKDEVEKKGKLELSVTKVKSEDNTIEDHYTETFIKLENSVVSTKLDTNINTEIHEVN